MERYAKINPFNYLLIRDFEKLQEIEEVKNVQPQI